MTQLARLVSALDTCAGRCSHFTIESASGSGFALFGGSKSRHLFERLYLGAEAPVPGRLSLHGPLSVDRYRTLARRYGLVVFCGSSAPPDLAGELLKVPVLVDMEMELPAVLEGPGARWTVSTKSNLSRIRRAKFQHDTQPAGGCLDEFYARMFRPAMVRRHGEEAYVPGLRELRATLPSDAEMLRILHDGRWVAGSLNHSSDEGYRLLRLGWLDGDAGLLRSGVVSALYWFNIKRAAALRHTRVLMGGVLPYLDNGLLQYKAFWGAGLSLLGRGWGAFGLLLDPEHPDCLRFLRDHSIVTRVEGGGYYVFSGSLPQAVAVTPTMLTGISRWYRWREQPLSTVHVTDPEVPAGLRRWVDPIALPT